MLMVLVQFLINFFAEDTTFIEYIINTKFKLNSTLLIPLQKIHDAFKSVKKSLGVGTFGSVYQTNLELPNGIK